MMKVFIGYDPRETIAFHVAAWSIVRRASQPVSITGLRLSQLPLTRPREGSTEFSFSRFLVPWLCRYEGAALFLDCDVLVLCDIAELFHLCAHSLKSVQVVQHDYQPRSATKFLNHPQQVYARKNWSSVMLFDCSMCRQLTPDYVNSASGLELHQFKWLEDRHIGSLPLIYNHLVGEYATNKNAKVVHFTNGGPWFPEYSDCEFADEWWAERESMLTAG